LNEKDKSADKFWKNSIDKELNTVSSKNFDKKGLLTVTSNDYSDYERSNTK